MITFKNYLDESTNTKVPESEFVKHYHEDPLGVFMHAKSSYLDVLGSAKSFSKEAAHLVQSHGGMSKDAFNSTVLTRFGKHLKNKGWPKHATKEWGEAEGSFLKEFSKG